MLNGLPAARKKLTPADKKSIHGGNADYLSEAYLSDHTAQIDFLNGNSAFAGVRACVKMTACPLRVFHLTRTGAPQ
ncbi:MAG: hypothetical protein JWP59_4282 [Massilia sp.]|jgi:hypothetical protein|nr:hypothetical protein [Massilia sp.]